MNKKGYLPDFAREEASLVSLKGVAYGLKAARGSGALEVSR